MTCVGRADHFGAQSPGVVRSDGRVWIDDYRRLYIAIASASELLATVVSRPRSAVVRQNANSTSVSGSASTSLSRVRFDFWRAPRKPQKPWRALRLSRSKSATPTVRLQAWQPWQRRVDAADRWTSTVLRTKASFYPDLHRATGARWRQEGRCHNLRYVFGTRAAEELGSRIRQEDRSTPPPVTAVLGYCQATRNSEWQRYCPIRR